MLAAIFDQDLDVFDVFTVIAAVLFLVAAFLSRPAHPAPANAYAGVVAWFGMALFAFGFLFMTP